MGGVETVTRRTALATDGASQGSRPAAPRGVLLGANAAAKPSCAPPICIGWVADNLVTSLWTESTLTSCGSEPHARLVPAPDCGCDVLASAAMSVVPPTAPPHTSSATLKCASRERAAAAASVTVSVQATQWGEQTLPARSSADADVKPEEEEAAVEGAASVCRSHADAVVNAGGPRASFRIGGGAAEDEEEAAARKAEMPVARAVVGPADVAGAGVAPTLNPPADDAGAGVGAAGRGAKNLDTDGWLPGAWTPRRRGGIPSTCVGPPNEHWQRWLLRWVLHAKRRGSALCSLNDTGSIDERSGSTFEVSSCLFVGLQQPGPGQAYGVHILVACRPGQTAVAQRTSRSDDSSNVDTGSRPSLSTVSGVVCRYQLRDSLHGAVPARL